MTNDEAQPLQYCQRTLELTWRELATNIVLGMGWIA